MRVAVLGFGLLTGMLCLLASTMPAHADDASAGCPLRPLAADAARLKSAPGVQSVVFAADNTRATVLFDDGGVLRLGTTGCVTPMVSARLWLAAEDGLSDAMWLQRARTVTDLVLASASAAQVDASLTNDAAVTHVDGGIKVDRALGNGSGYSLTVVRTPRDGLGSSLSLVFRNL
jgi:hypothetical protein